jgi:hypothetical protein
MATPAQIAANRANSLKSTGPNTLEGRGRAAMNALIHGMRSAIEAERDQESEKYQRRFSKWMAEFDPPTDSLEYQLAKTLNVSMELDRGESFFLMKRSDWLDNFKANLAEDARVLINRLFFDPNGPTALYGERGGFRTKPGKPSASFSGKADDPNEPAKILIELEKTQFGCQLLLDEWTYLKSKLESRWESPDRFRAIRLLGAQPIYAKEQRHIAEIFLASHVKTDGNTNPFQDLKDEMLPSKTENMEEEVYHKWPDIVRKNQKAAGRQLLSRLVEENMKRLVAKLEAFCPEACGKKVFKKQSFDDSPEGKRLKIQVEKLDASVNRRLSKIRKECRGDQGDSGSRRAWRDAGSSRVVGGGWRVAGADEGSARRAEAEGTTIGAAPAESGADPERTGGMIDRVLAHGFAGAEEVSPSVSVSANSSSDPHPDPLPEGEGEVWCSRSPLLSRPRLSPPASKTRSEQSDRISDRAEVESSAEGQVADEENTATWDAGSEAGDFGVKPASDTNEANFHGDVIKSQTAENLGVMAELAIGAGLDNDGGMQVVSPDLVCPISELESREAVVSGADDLEAGAVGLSEGDGVEVVESGAPAGPLVEIRAVARMDGSVSPAPAAAGRELRTEKRRFGATQAAGVTEREKARNIPVRQRKQRERLLEIEKKSLRELFASSPKLVEMVRQQLPREP